MKRTPRTSCVSSTLAVGLLLGACDSPHPTPSEPAAPRAERGVQDVSAAAAVADGQYRLQAAHSGQCLSVPNTAEGTQLRQQPCADAPAQRFALQRVTVGGGAYYRLKPGGAARCADVYKADTRDGAAVTQWDCGADATSKPNQLFALRQAGTDSYYLVAKHSGKCVDVFRDGAAVVQWRCHDGASQRFTLLKGGGTLSAPPATIVDNIRPGAPVVRRVFYDDTIAVYFGDGLNTNATWMTDHVKRSWQYIKRTYGSFGPDPRIYVVAHANKAFDYATVNTRFDDGFGYRNVIDLGGAWDWSRPQQVNYEVMTHELSHLVEGGGKDTKESPSFEVWGDGPWPEISVYDIYRGIGRADWAQDWSARLQTNTNGSYSADLPGRYYTFRDWFSPVYRQHGGAAVLNRYFALLSQCFPKHDITVGGGKTAKEYARRANVGEFVHFWSGAAGVNLKAQFTKAYTWNSKIEGEFRQAQQTFGCADTYAH